MRYLFHNIYGDSDELIATAPTDVVCVPFGWDHLTELRRNELIASLNLPHVSALPAIVFWFPEKTRAIKFEGLSDIIPAHWHELRVADLPQPWSWEKIDAAIQELITI